MSYEFCHLSNPTCNDDKKGDICRSSEQVHRDPSTVTEMHDMSMFLATHNVILTQVKASLSRIPGYEDVLCSIIKTCVCWYEQKQYLLPEEKYNIVKVQ